MEEVWKHYIHIYSVSNLGRVRNDKTNKILKPYINGHGYLRVTLSLGKRNKVKRMFVHRLVALTFIPNPCNKMTVNHKNGNKFDNTLDNLEWATNSENMKHAFESGLASNFFIKGTKNKRSKLTDDDVIWIKNNYIYGNRKFGCRALAKKYNMAFSNISRLISGEHYN